MLAPTKESSDQALLELARAVGEKLHARQWRIATAESCTAGWIAKVLTDVAGSSDWFDSGFITYSNAAKCRDVGVNSATLATHGAVSEATVREMAEGALQRTGVEVAVATTGIAGPTGAVAGKPVGTVWFALSTRRGQGIETIARVKLFAGDREAVRRQSVLFALSLVDGIDRVQ